jgi:hypothetical protein
LADVTSRSQLVLVCHVLPRGLVVESGLLELMLVRFESFRYFIVDVRRWDKPAWFSWSWKLSLSMLLVHILGVHSPVLVIREPESVLFYFEPLREPICSRTVIHDLAH